MGMRIVHTLLPLRSGDLVFDIGANVGDFTAGFVEKGCTVIAVEPQVRTHALLYYRYKRILQVKCICAACGEKPGSMTLHILEDRNSGDTQGTYIRSAYQCTHAEGETTRCRVTTLDALIAKYGKPRGIKIDVEGYEPNVLAGLHVPIDYLTFELHGWVPDKLPVCLAHFNRLGQYEFNFQNGEEHELQLQAWLSAKDFETWWMSKRFGSGDAHTRLIGTHTTND